MITIGIDPGNDTGWAALIDGSLYHVALDQMPHFPSEADVWIEVPQIYPHGGKGDPNDLIKVAVMVGRYAARADAQGCNVHLVHPHEWKGNAPKSVTAHRMKAKYPNLETLLTAFPKAKQHNVIDAVGIADYGYACTKARTK